SFSHSNVGKRFAAGVNNWNCIQRVYAHYNDTLYNCIQTFIGNVLHDPDNACAYMQQALSCLTAPFGALCPAPGKWFGCETYRMYLATRLYTCPASCSGQASLSLSLSLSLLGSRRQLYTVDPYLRPPISVMFSV